MAEVANYDKYDYDYKDYWGAREYEHLAEQYAIGDLIKPYSGNRFIDIGGSYGRNLPLYGNKYKEVIILDYSLQTLQKYEKQILERYPNAKLVAANVYNMPFIKGSFDGAMMVRVLHHLQEPEKYFMELSSILAQKGIIIQEFANKVHLKAKLKWVLSGKFSLLNREPYQQTTRSETEKEGSKEESIFLNFHPKHVKQMLMENYFVIDERQGCSYLRIGFLKRYLPKSIMLGLEKILQTVLSWTNISPSIFFLAHSENPTPDLSKQPFNEILSCPKCKNNATLNIDGDEAKCAQCNTTYHKHSTIWDLRV